MVCEGASGALVEAGEHAAPPTPEIGPDGAPSGASGISAPGPRRRRDPYAAMGMKTSLAGNARSASTFEVTISSPAARMCVR